MAISVDTVDEVPFQDGRRGPRKSPSFDIVQRALEGMKVRVSADDREELERTYKSLMAWRWRHREYPIALKKLGGVVYVWTLEQKGINAPETKPIAVHRLPLMSIIRPMEETAVEDGVDDSTSDA